MKTAMTNRREFLKKILALLGLTTFVAFLYPFFKYFSPPAGEAGGKMLVLSKAAVDRQLATLTPLAAAAETPIPTLQAGPSAQGLYPEPRGPDHRDLRRGRRAGAGLAWNGDDLRPAVPQALHGQVQAPVRLQD